MGVGAGLVSPVLKGCINLLEREKEGLKLLAIKAGKALNGAYQVLNKIGLQTEGSTYCQRTGEMG
jgi:hypothetical protein